MSDRQHAYLLLALKVTITVLFAGMVAWATVKGDERWVKQETYKAERSRAEYHEREMQQRTDKALERIENKVDQLLLKGARP